MNKKEPSKAQLEQKIKSAHIFIPKDKDSTSVYFDDRGLRLTYNTDFAIVETGFHRHVFSAITSQGYSRPYMYIRKFVELTLGVDCIVKDANGEATRSYRLFMEKLRNKEDDSDYNLAWYVDKWLYNIFAPLYSIDETVASTFIVYEQFLHNIARTEVVLAEKTEPVTSKQFADSLLAKLKEMLDAIDDYVIFDKVTDEELARQNIEAMMEQDADNSIEGEGQ